MSSSLPYVVNPGVMIRILQKVKEAQTPERFTTDFLDTKLGFKGGSARQFIPLAKKLCLLGSDGSPTDLYRKFRNSGTSKLAVAEALRKGYRDVFERNEYAYKLDKEKFKGLVVEITGLEAKNRVVQLICQTFEILRPLADFEAKEDVKRDGGVTPKSLEGDDHDREDFGLNLAYTINLVLPKTDDPSVLNAIFRALRENLLRK